MFREERVQLKILREYLRKGLAYYSGCYPSEEYVVKTLKNKFGWTDKRIEREKNVY